MKKRSFLRKFKNDAEMDLALESEDLSEDFCQRGIVKKMQMKKINLDLPLREIEQIDRIADRIGVARQPLIKLWIYERLKEEAV
ncbi:MAG: CopG family transcriptional regulator [Chlamydiae bacterium]|nr:CopG family transcriptional regulator [Chlamydiota bacterium]MBI3276578.1 CopG family transcriptional regulator [Chlamydiota bacterium]